MLYSFDTAPLLTLYSEHPSIVRHTVVMEGTRLRILQLLQRHDADTVKRLARTIGLAPATIRRHLDILQRDRLVAFREVRKKTGRPEHAFYLTEGGQESLPKGYDHLLGVLVHELSTITTEDTRNRNGQQLLELVFGRLPGSVVDMYQEDLAGRDLAHRLGILMQHLDDDDFSPEAEVADGTLRIKLLNCPFRSVALQDKSVCTYDLTLISSMLDMGVERQECIHDGDNGCMYTAVVDAKAEKELATVAPS